MLKGVYLKLLHTRRFELLFLLTFFLILAQTIESVFRIENAILKRYIGKSFQAYVADLFNKIPRYVYKHLLYH